MNMKEELDLFEIEEERNSLTLRDMLGIIWVNKWWFTASVVICLCLAVLYLSWTPNVYTRTASVLIKNDKGGGASESAAFEELGLFGVKNNVDNEVQIFKSTRLMKMMVEQLKLDQTYRCKERLQSVDLYARTPVTMEFIDLSELESASCVVTPLSMEKVKISGFAEGSSASLTISLNDTVNTSLGRVIITPTAYYSVDYFNTDIDVNKEIRADVVDRYRNDIQIELADKATTIIHITLRDVSPQRAEDVINTLIAVYNKDAIDDKNLIAVNTSNFINERLLIIDQELGQVDASIAAFKSENQLIDITSETGIYLNESSSYNREELSLENQKSLAGYLREYLIDPERRDKLIPANTGITDMNIENTIAGYNDMLLKREQMLRNSSGNNPVVADMSNALQAMRQSIINTVDNLIASLNLQIKNVKEKERLTKRKIFDVPTQQKHILTIERQQKIKEELYLYLLNKREENELIQSIAESNARVIDYATGPSIPVAPRKMFVLLGAIAAGGMIPVIILWLINMLNTTVRSRKDVENVTSIPFLGEVPLRDKKDKREIVVSESGRDSISEAFRIIRTNIDFMQTADKKNQVLVFTSYNPGSGKTFVSSNLAMSFVQTEKKVILVDMDIRKGTLTKNNEMDYSKGVTDYLSGRAETVDEIIAKGGINGKLDVINSGFVPPNPVELLLNDRLGKMIDELREMYDYIILDTVPAGIVADVSIINRLVDLTLYVIRAGKMDRRLLPDLEKMYRDNKFHNMCLILNAAEYKRLGYGYGYGGYGYSYGYGYGYGYANEGGK